MTESRLEQQQAALLRLARLLAEEPDPEQILQSVIAEAISLVGGNRGHMRRWDPDRHVLVAVASMPPHRLIYGEIAPGEGLSGRAAERNEPLLLRDYVGREGAITRPGRDKLSAAVAVPLRLDTHLIGTLYVASDEPQVQFTEEDAQSVMVLGSLATAALIGQERARLGGALLAARTAAHELNNQLALTVGYSEMVAKQPELSSGTQEMAREALRGARTAAVTVVRLQQMTHLEEIEMGAPGGAVLDLERSTKASDDPS